MYVYIYTHLQTNIFSSSVVVFQKYYSKEMEVYRLEISEFKFLYFMGSDDLVIFFFFSWQGDPVPCARCAGNGNYFSGLKSI